MRISMNPAGIQAAAGLLALATCAAVGAPARAVVINVNGADWEVTSTLVPGGTDVSAFQASYITSQPWSGNPATARSFAEALGGQLGYPNERQQYSPFFAYAANVTDPNPPGLATYTAAATLALGGSFTTFQPVSTASYNYATATRVTTDVPGPLPLLGGLAAFGWSRRLRRRTTLAPRP